MSSDYKSDDMGMGAGDETVDQGKGPLDKSTVTVDCPDGMSPKDGDKLTFCCVGEPSDGKMTGYFESMDGEKEGDDWEKGFMEQMSPRNDDQPESV